MSGAIILLIAVILLTLVFDFINGFHDAANAIATVVSTRVLSPRVAVLYGGVLNFVGALLGTEVAATIGKGLVVTSSITLQTVLCTIIAAIIWNLITWARGLPTSSSHAIIGSLLGATFFSTTIRPPDNKAVRGMVRIQAQTMFPTIPQRTADSRLVEPTPMIAVVMTCVVETGIPKWEAVPIIMAAVVSAAKPCTGCSRIILLPSVWMILQPPLIVPNPMTMAQESLTQSGTTKSSCG